MLAYSYGPAVNLINNTLSKIFLISLFFWQFSDLLLCQKHLYTVNGSLSENVSGYVILHLNSNISDTGLIYNRTFIIKGGIECPEIASLSLNGTLYSDWFFVDIGSQNVFFDLNKTKDNVVSNSKTNIENLEYKITEDSIKNVVKKDVSNMHGDSFLQTKIDDLILNFVIENPDSYVGFYKLIHEIRWNGSKPIYWNIYNKLSKKIKYSKEGRTLLTNLKIAKRFTINQYFPEYNNLVNIYENKVRISDYFSKNKFTFVDIWSYSCGPCIGQFESLNSIYSKYKEFGFEILGISIDPEVHKSELLNTIRSNQLSWPQMWDKNSEQSKKYKLEYFPNTYLLNRKGKIIYKDIGLKELELFLINKLL